MGGGLLSLTEFRRHRNADRRGRRLLANVLGGALTGNFMPLGVELFYTSLDPVGEVFAAFMAGVSWGSFAEIKRHKLTQKVREALAALLAEDPGD